MIYNPTRVADFPALRARVEAHMARAGWAEPLWLGTTVDDPGAGMCAEAAEENADLVIVCGGDGTVRVCAQALAGTDTPLALLPSGTGNLLARNLGIPLDDEDAALRIAVSGADRHIDVAAVEDHKFVVMAGLGFDAAIMRDASEGLKRTIGWPAYVVSGARHLRGRGIRVRVTLDDGKPFSRRVRTAGCGQRRQAAGRDPAAARRRAGRRGARRGAHRPRQHRRLGAGGGPGDDPPRTGGPQGRAVPGPARAARDRPSDAAPARR